MMLLIKTLWVVSQFEPPRLERVSRMGGECHERCLHQAARRVDDTAIRPSGPPPIDDR